MGNVAVAIVDRGVRGNRKYVTADVTMSASYATNGDTIVAADIAKLLPEGETLAQLLDFTFINRGASGHSLELDRANSKVKAFNGTTEIANATNLSAVVGRLHAEYGRRTGSFEGT